MVYSPKVYLYRRVVQAKLFIDGNFNCAINLDAIADEACFSKFHFIRLFKSIYSKTPHQYLNSVRIREAEILLKRGIPVTEVCYAVGFDSVGSFSSLFKRTIKWSPSSYQKHHLQRQKDMRQEPFKFIPNCFLEPKTTVKTAILNK